MDAGAWWDKAKKYPLGFNGSYGRGWDGATLPVDLGARQGRNEDDLGMWDTF